MVRLTTIPLSAVSRDDCYRLSFPLHPEKYGEIARLIPGMPLLVLDRQKRIISGHDFYAYQKKRGRKLTAALETELPVKEAFFFAFHWKNIFDGFNLYEKVMFVKKVLPLSTPGEIQKRVHLDIPVTEAWLKKFAPYLSPPFKNLLIREAISFRILLRLADVRQVDRKAIAALFSRVTFNENQQQKILEMLEEISFRDRLSWKDIFKKKHIPGLMTRQMPQKAIIEALAELRFPGFCRYRKEWQERNRKLFAAMDIQIKPHPFFEKEEVEICLRAPNLEKAKKLLEKMKKYCRP